MKNEKLILLDLFSGMGGFHLGLSDAGFDFKKVYYSEIDKHVIANYKYNFKDAEHIGSVEHILSSGIRRPNVITFGSPCQDFSLAGKRKGLSGDRSSLIEYAIDAISYFRPDVFIWENVKGTFSSNAGEDFWAIIQAFANIGGYEIEWQLVNTSWLLPQNRERIYLVGHLATSFRYWKGVFPIGEYDELFNKEKGIKPSIQTKNSTTITSNYAKMGTDNTYILVPSATKNGYEEATEGDSINLQFPDSKTRRGRVGKGVAQTLDCNCNQGVIQLNNSKESGGKQPFQHNRIYDERGLSPALNTDSRSPFIRSVLTPDRLDKRQNGRRMKEPGEPSFTLTSQDRHGVFDGLRIRRLTEIECERLQGFPDNWTQYGDYDGKVRKISKSQRYKMIGNAVTAKMVELIGKRILKNFKNQPTEVGLAKST